MKKSIVVTACTLAMLVSFSSFTYVSRCGAEDAGVRTPNEATGASSYQVPDDKVQKWEALKNVAGKNYDACLEHCGMEQNCLERCEAAYNSRLADDYKMLMNE